VRDHHHPHDDHHIIIIIIIGIIMLLLPCQIPPEVMRALDESEAEVLLQTREGARKALTHTVFRAVFAVLAILQVIDQPTGQVANALLVKVAM
jgi:hypothetical protein